MEHITQIVLAVFASTGFWTLLNTILANRRERKTASTEKIATLERGLRGLLHEKLIERCEFFINKGTITESEYRDLDEYIYSPYRDLDGNGTGEEYMRRVQELLFEGSRK